MPRPSRLAALLLLATAVLCCAGCSKKLQDTIGLPNQRPSVSLEATSAPTGDAEALATRLHWTASDPDGRVDHYLVTEDLAAFEREPGWTATTARDQTLSYRRAATTGVAPTGAAARPFRFFAVRAVDDRGLTSLPSYVAMFDENVAPTVTIDQPRPSSLISATVPPDVWVYWHGSDADGPGGRPAKYKYLLVRRDGTIPWEAWISNPDSLRRQFAPGFAGWDSISGDSTRVHYANLAVGSEYLFVITALDADGAYDPVFSLNKNMLRFQVVPQGSTGPLLTIFNETFTYRYPSGGIPAVLDSNWVIRTQAPAGQPLTVNWYAEPPAGSIVQGYRWALDIGDIHDETPRSEPNDVAHWSRWDGVKQSVTLNPGLIPPASGTRRLFVEAVDVNGLMSLGVVEFRFVAPAFDRDLLIVMDTPRLKVDQAVVGHPDSLSAPSGNWPTFAELDTFLFAVGGVRWRMTPAGTLSPPGIFKGYAYDTLGPQRGSGAPTVTLDVLSHYRHVVWVADFGGSESSMLRTMSMAGQQSPLASWVKSGGKLWALGGGFGNATNSPWNSTTNDLTYRIYSSVGTRPDLVPGRFMYDLTHWRSQFTLAPTSPCVVRRSPFPVSDPAGTSGFTLLPSVLGNKQATTDPLPPYRGGTYYSLTVNVPLEYLSLPNAVVERVIPGPKQSFLVQALDTLMVATNAYLPPQGANPAVDRIVNPVMTHYHGADCGPVVFTGYDIWSWTRGDCVGLVDAVLHGYWGLARAASSPEAVVKAASPRRPTAGR
jgi:hypothetical protein